MSIGAGLTLVTGNTGSGKTAMVVKMMAETKDRPLFVMGIPELKIEHFNCPPVDEWTELRPDPDDPSLLLPYFTFPPNSVVVLDEAQRVFRPRPLGSKVPDVVAAFETRRHTGVDFVLLTQDPTFVDANIRKLVKRHIHIHETPLWSYRLEWTGMGDPKDRASRELAQREKYKPPKEVFGLYKSAELHTKETKKRPFLIYVIPFLVSGLVIGGWYLKGRIEERLSPKQVASAAPQNHGELQGNAAVVSEGGEKVKTAEQYVMSYEPRIKGLAHTAPVFDGLTKPVDVPIIEGCVQSKRGCQCYDQRGNHYRTTFEICKQFMTEGIFFDFKMSSEIVANEPKTTKGKADKGESRQVAENVPALHETAPVKVSELGNDSTNPRFNVALRGK